MALVRETPVRRQNTWCLYQSGQTPVRATVGGYRETLNRFACLRFTHRRSVRLALAKVKGWKPALLNDRLSQTDTFAPRRAPEVPRPLAASS